MAGFSSSNGDILPSMRSLRAADSKLSAGFYPAAIIDFALFRLSRWLFAALLLMMPMGRQGAAMIEKLL